MRGSICGVLAFVAGFAFPAYGQNAAAVQDESKQSKVPFTVEYEVTIEKTLPDGTVTTQISHEVRAGDSEGRIYSSDGTIQDPIARTLTFLDSAHHIATVRKLVPEQEIPSNQSDCVVVYVTRENSTSERPNETADADPAKIAAGKILFYAMKPSAHSPFPIPKLEWPIGETTKEDLGTDTILGIAARGMRVMTIYPAGNPGPNRSPWESLETWTATEDIPFDPVLRRVSVDPIGGRITTGIVSLHIGDPELSLFQPPDGYKIFKEQLRGAPCPQPEAPHQ